MGEAVKPPGPYTKFMGRWGWPLMGFFAAAPVLAHALDWRKRTEVKRRVADEKKRQLRQGVTDIQADVLPSAEDVYKAAAFFRTLESIPKSDVEKLDLVEQVLRSRK